MLILPPNLRIYIATAATDMRRSFDSLAEMVRSELKGNPRSGDLYVFLGASGNRAKLLYWESSGYWLYYKRLEKGKFKIPIKRDACAVLEVKAAELSLLLEGIDLDGAKHRATFFREAVR